MIKLKNNIEDLLDSLSKSKFRGSFHLNKKMKNYVKEKGFDKIKSDARDLITKRIAPENPNNDGKQTPMRQVHPVFIAQHATGCCCRGCLERIHGIKKGHELSNEEIEYVVKKIKLHKICNKRRNRCKYAINNKTRARYNNKGVNGI